MLSFRFFCIFTFICSFVKKQMCLLYTTPRVEQAFICSLEVLAVLFIQFYASFAYKLRVIILKYSPSLLVCWCVFAFTCHPTCLLLLVSRRSNTISWYSIFIRTHTVSPRGFMGPIYAHSYGQPILVHFSAQCIRRVMCSLNSSFLFMRHISHGNQLVARVT